MFRSFMGVNVGGNADSDVTANGVEATHHAAADQLVLPGRRTQLRQERAGRGRSGDRRSGRRAAAGHSGVDVLAEGQLELPARRLARGVHRRRRCLPGRAQDVVHRRHRQRRQRSSHRRIPNYTTKDYIDRGPARRRDARAATSCRCTRTTCSTSTRIQTASTASGAGHCNDPEAAHDRRSVQRRVLTI